MSLADMDAAEKPAADLTCADVRQLLSEAIGITTARHRSVPSADSSTGATPPVTSR